MNPSDRVLVDHCGDCCAEIPVGGDLLCPRCRAIEEAEYQERLARRTADSSSLTNYLFDTAVLLARVR